MNHIKDLLLALLRIDPKERISAHELAEKARLIPNQDREDFLAKSRA